MVNYLRSNPEDQNDMIRELVEPAPGKTRLDQAGFINPSSLKTRIRSCCWETKAGPEAFYDYNVARVLDKACQVGTMKIFTELSKRAVLIFDMDMKHVSFDTTSVSVLGDYEQGSHDANTER